jgi:hypothetical protein
VRVRVGCMHVCNAECVDVIPGKRARLEAANGAAGAGTTLGELLAQVSPK